MLSNEVSIERKIKETVIAIELKQNYSDDQILEWYLNPIFYGATAYGA
ncbi:MAG: transglycosylase domain-containing protein, partial [Deltaproteobacteria bacterium]|nr:transglycosylase domain-containing protein [Deltaproteobacteria bacterium]